MIKRSSIISASMMVFILWFALLMPTRGLFAQSASDPQTVKELSYEEKLQRWNSFSEEKKEAIRKKARGMSEKKFGQLENNLKKMKHFEPAEQTRVKHNFQRMRQFEPQQRRRIKENFQRFERLPPERKQQFRQRFLPGRMRPGLDRQSGFDTSENRFNNGDKPQQFPRQPQMQNPDARPNSRPFRDGQRPFQNQNWAPPGMQNSNRAPNNNRWEGNPDPQKKPGFNEPKAGIERRFPGNRQPGDDNRFQRRNPQQPNQPGFRKGPGFRRPNQQNGENIEQRNGEVRNFRQKMMEYNQQNPGENGRFRERWREIRDFREGFGLPQNPDKPKIGPNQGNRFPGNGNPENRPPFGPERQNQPDQNGQFDKRNEIDKPGKADEVDKPDQQKSQFRPENRGENGEMQKPNRPMRPLKDGQKPERPAGRFRPMNNPPGQGPRRPNFQGPDKPAKPVPEKK